MPRGEPAAWRHGRLVYVDAPLKDIIADANRYSREPIEIADEGVANVRVSVTYPSDRIEEMVAALSRSLSLEIERRGIGRHRAKSERTERLTLNGDPRWAMAKRRILTRRRQVSRAQTQVWTPRGLPAFGRSGRSACADARYGDRDRRASGDLPLLVD